MILTLLKPFFDVFHVQTRKSTAFCPFQDGLVVELCQWINGGGLLVDVRSIDDRSMDVLV